MTTRSAPDQILSHPVIVDEIPADGLGVTVVAPPAACAQLASLNGLVALRALRGDLRLRHEPGGGVRISGEVVGEVTYTCVVTLEAFDATVRDAVDVVGLPPARLAAYRADRARTVPSDEGDDLDEPDLIENGTVDVGVLVAEHLTLGLDPYPRRPGAVLTVPAAAEPPIVSPFAALRPRTQERS